MKYAKLFSAITLLVPLASWAAGVATIDARGDRYTLEYNDQRMRVESAQRPQIYLLAHHDALYAVTSAGGRPLVLEGKAILGLLAAGGKGSPVATSPDDIANVVSLQPTGKTETIAGINGDVHTLTYVTRGGQQRSLEAVLSTDPRVAELTHNVGQIAVAFQRSTGVDNQGAQELLRLLQTRNVGLLRVGADFRLAALNANAPAAERLQLPESPLSLQGLESLFSGMRR